jgi:hypothetical protein
MAEVLINPQVELAKRRHLVGIIVCNPMEVDDGEVVVDSAGERTNEWDSFFGVSSGVERTECTTAVGSTNGTLIVGGFETMLLLAIGALEDDEGAIDGVRGRDIARAEVNRRSCSDERRWQQINLLI